jgi:hypothetical protein
MLSAVIPSGTLNTGTAQDEISEADSYLADLKNSTHKNRTFEQNIAN